MLGSLNHLVAYLAKSMAEAENIKVGMSVLVDKWNKTYFSQGIAAPSGFNVTENIPPEWLSMLDDQ